MVTLLESNANSKSTTKLVGVFFGFDVEYNKTPNMTQVGMYLLMRLRAIVLGECGG